MEPKSIRTWLFTNEPDIYNCDVDVWIDCFPSGIDQQWLFYFSLQVDFDGHDEWSHGGFQWSGATEFASNGNKGVNWGGGCDWGGYGGIGVNNTPFRWRQRTWYRYRVTRAGADQSGFHHWTFLVMEYSTGEEHAFGTVRTRSSTIRRAVVFTETGYGVPCDSPSVRVEWRSPCFRSPCGEFAAPTGIADYNGTCTNPGNTNQGLLSESPRRWFHSTNTPRQEPAIARLW
jgi:hypothetical protein